MFLVCCGLPQKYLGAINKFNERQHNEKISEYINVFVKPKIPEIIYLIQKLTEFNTNSRFNVNQALKWCSENKIFQKYFPIELVEINPKVDN